MRNMSIMNHIMYVYVTSSSSKIDEFDLQIKIFSVVKRNLFVKGAMLILGQWES